MKDVSCSHYRSRRIVKTTVYHPRVFCILPISTVNGKRVEDNTPSCLIEVRWLDNSVLETSILLTPSFSDRETGSRVSTDRYVDPNFGSLFVLLKRVL